MLHLVAADHTIPAHLRSKNVEAMGYSLVMVQNLVAISYYVKVCRDPKNLDPRAPPPEIGGMVEHKNLSADVLPCRIWWLDDKRYEGKQWIKMGSCGPPLGL